MAYGTARILLFGICPLRKSASHIVAVISSCTVLQSKLPTMIGLVVLEEDWFAARAAKSVMGRIVDVLEA